LSQKRYKEFVELHTFEKLKDVDKMFGGMSAIYPQAREKELATLEAEAKADDLPRVLLETTRGPVTIELFENEAPNTVANFIQLVEDGYYDGADFYQVVDDFLALGGDPVGDGTGTSGRLIPDEHDRAGSRQLFRGYLLMAKVPDPADKGSFVPNSASSQFAIALVPMIREDRKQTVFGRVIEGMEVVCSFRRVDPAKKKEKVVQLPPDRIETAKVLRKRDHEYKVEYLK
jgi:cyclophilin family peptidyl-prolyl cis-trans isomerase